jgi:hypothetical protein
MSDRLAISTAFSVLMMAGYVLFGADAVRTPVGPDSLGTPVSVSAPVLPLPSISWALDLLGLPAVR